MNWHERERKLSTRAHIIERYDTQYSCVCVSFKNDIFYDSWLGLFPCRGIKRVATTCRHRRVDRGYDRSVRAFAVWNVFKYEGIVSRGSDRSTKLLRINKYKAKLFFGRTIRRIGSPPSATVYQLLPRCPSDRRFFCWLFLKHPNFSNTTKQHINTYEMLFLEHPSFSSYKKENRNARFGISISALLGLFLKHPNFSNTTKQHTNTYECSGLLISTSR